MCCCFMMDVLWDSYGNLYILLEKDYLSSNMQIFSSFHASYRHTVQALVMSLFPRYEVGCIPVMNEGDGTFLL